MERAWYCIQQATSKGGGREGGVSSLEMVASRCRIHQFISLFMIKLLKYFIFNSALIFLRCYAQSLLVTCQSRCHFVRPSKQNTFIISCFFLLKFVSIYSNLVQTRDGWITRIWVGSVCEYDGFNWALCVGRLRICALDLHWIRLAPLSKIVSSTSSWNPFRHASHGPPDHCWAKPGTVYTWRRGGRESAVTQESLRTSCSCSNCRRGTSRLGKV